MRGRLDFKTKKQLLLNAENLCGALGIELTKEFSEAAKKAEERREKHRISERKRYHANIEKEREKCRIRKRIAYAAQKAQVRASQVRASQAIEEVHT